MKKKVLLLFKFDCVQDEVLRFFDTFHSFTYRQVSSPAEILQASVLEDTNR